MSNQAPTRPHTTWRLAILLALVGSFLVGLVVIAFVWPTATASAHDLPVAIAGPVAQTQVVEEAIDAASADLIEFHLVGDRAAAVTSIERRDTYGAVVLGERPEVLVASSSNAMATDLLRSLAAQLRATYATRVAAAGSNTSTVILTDFVPLSVDDPSGAGLTSAFFPLVLGGMLGGILISLLVAGVARRLTALLVYSAGAGLLVATIMQPIFVILQGSFIVNTLAIGLSMLGTASLIVGITALIGSRGIAIGAVITMLIGNPISGATMPYQFIAGPWGQIGQYFVPGAASSLIRELSYFPDADPMMQWLVLAGWAVAGFLLSVTGHVRSRATSRLAESELEPVAASRREGVPPIGRSGATARSLYRVAAAQIGGRIPSRPLSVRRYDLRAWSVPSSHRVRADP